MRRKNKIFLCGFACLLVIIYFVKPNGIKMISTIPSEFQNQQFQHEFINGMTYIIQNAETVYPVIDDGMYLYVLNGAGKDFKSYSLDKDKKEIVIRQNIVNPSIRSEEMFQMVKISYNDIKPLIESNKIKVRISYMYLDQQSTLLEYDFNSKQSKMIAKNLVGK